MEMAKMENNEIKNSKLIPRLRFPGFEGEWEEKKLGEVTDDIYQPQTISKDQFTKVGYPVYGANGIIGFYDKYNHETDQILVTCRGSSCGTINFSKGKCWITGNAMVVCLDKVENKSNKSFFYYLLNSCDLTKLVTGSGQPQIVRTPMLNLPILIPSLSEQQKIASCLSELDNLIAAQGQKVDALKEKKKGLMQQLFPQPGETTPRLRFPGFEGEWEEKKLGEVGETISGLTYSPSNVTSDSNGLLVLRSSNIKNRTLCFDDNVYVQSIKKYNPVKENDILICVRNGSSSLIGKNALIPSGLSAAFGAFMMVFRTKHWSFVFQLLQTVTYSKQIEQNLGARINSINSEDFKKYQFLFPPTPAEQQKIASCLSSLDDLIAAESAKVEALKDHKKGLMQQLFPQGSEISRFSNTDARECDEPLGDARECDTPRSDESIQQTSKD